MYCTIQLQLFEVSTDISRQGLWSCIRLSNIITIRGRDRLKDLLWNLIERVVLSSILLSVILFTHTHLSLSLYIYTYIGGSLARNSANIFGSYILFDAQGSSVPRERELPFCRIECVCILCYWFIRQEERERERDGDTEIWIPKLWLILE